MCYKIDNSFISDNSSESGIDIRFDNSSESDMYCKRCLQITNINDAAGPFDIKPDDIITISSDIYSSAYSDADIKVHSRTITFKDLCTAIARQIVANDLNIENGAV